MGNTLNALIPENSIISNSIGNIGNYSWVLWIILGVMVFGGIGFIIVQANLARKQWTHKLYIKRVINSLDELSEPEVIRMKRFPDKKLTDFFILEKPLLGTHIFQTTGMYNALGNAFSIILDRNNRIFTEKKAKLDRTKGVMNVSAVHPNVDLRWHQNLEAFEKMYEIKPGVDWAKIGKWALMIILVLGAVILGIVALQEHTEQVKIQAERDKEIASAMVSFSGAMDALEGSILTQVVLFETMKDMYGEAKLKEIINGFNADAYFNTVKYTNVTR